jgi:hypothetical protein
MAEASKPGEVVRPDPGEVVRPDPDETARPDPDEVVTSSQLLGWYWTRAQLDQIARRLGVSKSGNKATLTQRLEHHLDGIPAREAPRPRVAPQLTPPFDPSDVVPPGQRMTRALRDWFVERVGSSFRFDFYMRAFFTDPAGRTLSDAIDLWHATRDAPAPQIGAQFEYNRFTRAFRQAHPEATRSDLLEAWQRYKDTPTHDRTRDART